MNPPKRRGETDSKQSHGMTCLVHTGHGLSAKSPPGGTRHHVNQNTSFQAHSMEWAFFLHFDSVILANGMSSKRVAIHFLSNYKYRATSVSDNGGCIRS